MYNTRSRGRIVLAGSVRSHQGMRVNMPPSDLTPSQALDVLESEEVILGTEVSLTGHVIASERSDNDDNDDDNDMVSIDCKQLKLSSPREGFRHDENKIQPQPQNQNLILAPNVQTNQGTISGLESSPQNDRGATSGTGGGLSS